jgi:hypothetical protein
MASKGYVVSVATDSRLFEQGVRMGIIKPVEDADEALTDLGKNKGADQLERSLKDAQKTTDKLGDEARKTAQQMQDDYRATARAAKKADDDSSSSFELSTREKRKLSRETIHEIGDEAKQNASETFSSFDGSAQSFVDGIQGTLGGLVGSLGPIGLAAGAAGALGIGLINGALGKADEDTQQFRQDVADLATDLIETGRDGEHSIGYIVDQLKKMATETDPNAVSLKKIHDQAKQLGVPFKDLAIAYASGGDALDAQIESLKKLSKQTAQSSTDFGNFGSSLSNANNKAVSGIQDQIKALEHQRDEQKAAAAEEHDYVATGAADLEAKADLIGKVNEAYDDAAGSVSDYVDAESGVFDTSKYIAAMQQKETALREYQQNLVDFGGSLGPEATGYLESLGADQASTLLEAYKNATADQKTTLQQIWEQAGSDNSGSYVSGFKNGIPTSIDGPTVKVHGDDSDYQAVIARIKANPPKITIPTTAAVYIGGKRVY